MLFGSIASSLGEAMVLVAIATAGWILLVQKLLSLNPEVKDVAKKAATQKAISLIAKWLKP